MDDIGCVCDCVLLSGSVLTCYCDSICVFLCVCVCVFVDNVWTKLLSVCVVLYLLGVITDGRPIVRLPTLLVGGTHARTHERTHAHTRSPMTQYPYGIHSKLKHQSTHFLIINILCLSL